MAGAALAGAVALGGAGGAQAGNDSTNAAWRNLPDIVAHITMTVNNKTIEKEINLGTHYQSPMAAKQAVTKWLEEKGVKNYTINLERVRSVDEDIAMTENQDELARILELGGVQLTEQLSADQQFDIIEDMVLELAEAHGVDAEQIWEDFESVDDHELFETAAWRRSAGKSKSGGLNAKGVASYRRENPGSKLQTAVTTKPSKLKPGSKAAKRRKSFCARMGGVKGPMKKPNGKPTRKALALRKWNC